MSRLLLLLLGAWLGLLLASWVIAGVNFRTVDRVLGPERRAGLDERLSGVPAAERRQVLRHLASEINRWLFRSWSLAQLALGALGLALSLRLSGASRLLLAAATLLALVQALGLAGRITELGRAIDFVPRPLPPETARSFGRLHAAYVLADLLKAGLLSTAAWLLIRRPLP